jgi:hypothetical protein
VKSDTIGIHMFADYSPGLKDHQHAFWHHCRG